ncbi:MAG: MFS transporter [Betaproteobacteria bacterium]|nr:MFS transporter [Betaproteobacteria bacterium]
MLNRRQIGALAFGSFAMATGMMVITGMLVEMADDLGLPVTVAGQLIAAAPLVLAVASPTLALITSRLSRRTLLIWGGLICAASHFLAAMSGSFTMLVMARALTGLGAACFMPQTPATAVMLSPPNRGGRTLALVFIGYGVANSVGLPVGAWLGEAIGWRPTLAILGGLCLAVTAWVWLVLPAKISQSRLNAGAILELARDRAIVSTIAVGFLQSLAQFTVFAYIAPAVRESIGGGATLVAVLLAVFGVSGIIGSTVSSRFADRLGPVRMCAISIAIMVASFLVWSLSRGSEPLTCLAMVLWGFGCFPITSAIPVRLIALNPALASASISFNNTASFGGAAIGTVLGAAMIGAAGYGSLGWVGNAIFIAALRMLWVSARQSRERGIRY